MMFLGKLFTVIGVAMLGIVGALAQDEDTVFNGISKITNASSELQYSVSKLNVANFPSEGEIMVSGIQNIIDTVKEYTDIIDGTNLTVTKVAGPFPDDVAKEIVDVLTGFVLLLNTFIGKHSLASQFFLTAPIAAVLRTLEAVVDTFAFAVIGLIPTQEDDAQSQLDDLTVTFKKAIKTYRY